MARHVWAHPVTAGLLLLLAAPAADADPSAAELASAREMFSEARRAEDAGRWTEALIKLKGVANVKMTPQVRFHLGLCQEHTNQLVDALNSFELARSEAADLSVTTVVDEAKEHAANIRARVPKLFIVLPPGADTKVALDGQPIASAVLNRPLPVDPGQHKISATAKGGRFYASDISVVEGEEKRIEIALSPEGPLSEPLLQATETAHTRDMGTDTPSTGRPSTWGWIAVGVGGAALAGAGIAAAVRQSAIQHIDDVCPSHQNCPRSLESSQSQARTWGPTAIALGAVGAAAAVTGVVLLLSPSLGASKTKVSMGPWIDATSVGAVGAAQW